MDIDTSSPVMVTGATGYVAGWIVKALLDAGLTVHAAVRDPDSAAKVQHLADMAADAPGSIRFFKADLLDEGSYGAAMNGCSIVFHTASPFVIDVADPQRDLVDPAVKGTANVLNSVNGTQSVKRVVLTSSCAAIYGDAADCAHAPGGILTEAVWNTSSSLTHQPYSFSKAEAEKAAWEIAAAQSRWDLVVINPSLIIGPGTRPDATSEVFRTIRQMGDGTLKSGAPRVGIGVVDVREVAQAHINAAFTPEAEGRHILNGTNTDFVEIGQALAETFGKDYPLPTKALPKPVLWLIGPFVNKSLTRRFIARNVNHPWKADNAKSRQALGVSYRPMKDSLTEMFQQMIEAGAFKKA
ncbi:NAD-dependent epimerase/dehydratase family protein [Hoeflea poritis]|uniref:NAD-dependent epimerase/dehydratase family protein n=1 Tax=Hoeflea poritis TaxID=2993659 RepID=A0ABT4VJR2_9HYPH|nr:NAD-dependent epimerase/dehydratase family protein [Hoeflea poritis]MDA4844947.1 NAD-dependent epimerase/dehydratase family protein [Hoeflea poritis]